MATLVRSQRRKFPARLFKELAAPWDEVGPFLALILRIAILVHRSRALTHSPPMSIRIDRHTIFLKFPLGWLEDHDILLTPHLVDPNVTREAIADNDLSASRTGIFNLGFVAIRTTGEGARFARWWNDRLLDWCYDDMPSGLFVDQRWCDHVPALFDKVKVVRDPGYNVASWNLSTRKVQVGNDGVISVNGHRLRFWHFTKLGPMGDAMTRKYGAENFPVYEIWNWYRRQVAAATDPAIPAGWWAYGVYSDGEPIQKPHRELYRARGDLQAAFPTPFDVTDGGYRQWLAREGLYAPAL